MLTLTQMLRKEGVVNKFVEYFGPALRQMKVPHRALVANMAPEYGATVGFFPIDEQTLAYLRETGRTDGEVELVERYAKEQQLFRAADAATPTTPQYSKVLRLDLGTIEPCVAGPKRPQDRVPLAAGEGGLSSAPCRPRRASAASACAESGAGRGPQPWPADGRSETIGHGAVVIAAITSCTNTSNPDVMLAAGLLAKKAVERGLSGQALREDEPGPRQPRGDRLPARDRAGQAAGATGLPHRRLRLHDVHRQQRAAARAGGQGRRTRATWWRRPCSAATATSRAASSPLVKANYLASPPLVVAYALAGAVDIDLTSEPLGTGRDGRPVYLKDIWPSAAEVAAATAGRSGPRCSAPATADAFEGNRSGTPCRWPPSELYRLGRGQHVHPGAAVPGGPARAARARSGRSAGRGCCWRWAIR